MGEGYQSTLNVQISSIQQTGSCPSSAQSFAGDMLEDEEEEPVESDPDPDSVILVKTPSNPSTKNLQIMIENVGTLAVVLIAFMILNCLCFSVRFYKYCWRRWKDKQSEIKYKSVVDTEAESQDEML